MQYPFTESDVARFNALTHFPRPVEQWNESYWQDVNSYRRWVTRTLRKWGISQIPKNVSDALDRYMRELRNYGMATIRSREVAPPWTVTGRSNYRGKPERARSIEQRAYDKLESARAGISKAVGKYSPRAAVSSDDPEAVVKLKEKIARLEQMQETMRSANKIVRKKIPDSEKIAQLSAMPHISEATAAKLLEKDFAGRIGFPDYQLNNNGSEIRRLKKRIEQLQQTRSMPEEKFEFDGGSLLINPTDNRVQIFFDDMPNSDVRSDLKSHGFVFSQFNASWQRKLSTQAVYWAKDVLARHGMNIGESVGHKSPEPPSEPEPSADALKSLTETGEGSDPPPAKKPSAKKPSAKKPSAKKPSAKKPSAKKPSAKKPSAKKPSAKKPSARKLLITDPGAFEKLASIEGKVWEHKQKAGGVKLDNSFALNLEAFKVIEEQGLAGLDIPLSDLDPAAGAIAGFAGTGYIVMPDGEIMLDGDSASAAKRKKASQIMQLTE